MMKAFILLLFSSTLLANPEVVKELQQYCSDSSLIENLKYLEEFAENEDVEKSIIDVYEHCQDYLKCDPALFESKTHFMTYTQEILEAGWRGEIKTLTRLIKDQYKSRSIISHWERLQEYAQKLKVSPHSFIKENTITKYLEKGREISEQNRAQCTAINNGLSLGSARDQDSIGWCYAHTTADLLSHRYGQIFSAVDVAHTFNLERGKDHLESGGSVESAFYATLRRGLCLEEHLPSSDYQFSMMDSYYQAMNSIESLLRGADRNPRSLTTLCEECKADILKIFPQTSIEEMLKIAQAGDDPMSALYDFSCKQRFRPSGWPQMTTLKKDFINLFNARTANGLIRAIDEQLQKKNIVGISYDSNFLYEHNYSGKSIDRTNHASTVVGRRFNPQTGACDYLVRNSWGTDCKGYDWDYTCEEGLIWVPSYDLGEALDEVHYIK